MLHKLAAVASVRVSVGSDHPLVDAPGRLDLNGLNGGEQGRDPLALLVGQQVGAGVQDPTGGVERVAGGLAVAVGVDCEVLTDNAF